MPHHFSLKHIETISSYNMLLDLLPATPSETASMTLPITNGSLYSLSKKHRTWNPRNEEIDLNSANAKLIPGKVLAKHIVISGVFLVTFWGPKNDDQWGDRQEGFPPAALGDLDDRQDDLGCPGTSSEDVWYRVKLQAEFL